MADRTITFTQDEYDALNDVEQNGDVGEWLDALRGILDKLDKAKAAR